MSSKIDSKNFRSLKFAVPAGFNVDRSAGILRNLSLLEAGREAKGHGLYVDDETVKTAHDCAAARKQLKGAMRHLSWDDYFSKGSDRVLDFPGWFDGFSIKAGALVAEKFEFYETFRTDEENGGKQTFARIMEIADKTPDVIGLSIEAWGYAVFVAEDGKEYGTKPDGVALKYDGVPALRVTDLFFAAFVDEPAATSGLFARFSSLFGGKQISAKARLELETALEAWAAAHLGAGQGSVPAPTNPGSPTDFSATMKIIADLKAKITDSKQFAAAMAIVGLTPNDKLATLTVGEVEAQLVTADLTAARAEVTRLTADLAVANKKATDLEAALAAEKKKIETFKKSGKVEALDLGAGAGGGGALDGAANPFVKGANFNRAKQAELKKSDPVRYEQLKAAAAQSSGVVAFSPLSVSSTRFFAAGFAAIALVIAFFLGLSAFIGAPAAAVVVLGANVFVASRGLHVFCANEWTRIADLWVPEVIAEAMAEPVVERTAFIDSGVVITNTELKTLAQGPGTEVSIPFIIEPNHDDQLQTQDTAPEVRRITSGLQNASFFNRVSPLGVHALAEVVTGVRKGGDLITALAGYIQSLRKRQRNRLVIKQLSGLFAVAAVPDHNSGAFKALRKDHFLEAGASPADDYLIDSTKMLNALALLGENKELMEGGAIIMHSVIEAALSDQDQIDYEKNSEGNIILRRWKGMKVFLSDLMVRDGGTSGKVYYTFFCGLGSIAMDDKDQVVTDKSGYVAALQLDQGDIAKNNVAIYDRTRFILHPQGAEWAGTPANTDGGPSNAEAATVANWTLGANDVKNTRIVCLRTNG